MPEFILGIDIGTSSCKTILIDSEGNIIGVSQHYYKLYCQKYGWAEQDPEDWFQAFKLSLKEIRKKFPAAVGKISAIGVTGQMIGLTILDKDMDILHPSIIWMDQRCLPQVEHLKSNYNKLIGNITFNPINVSYTLPKMLWLRENHENIWKRMYKIQLPKDYIRLKLTKNWVMEYSDGSGTLLMDVKKLKWSEEILDIVNIEKDKLPELIPSWEIAGYLAKDIALELGITAGIPVIAGAGDLAAENLSAGIINSDMQLIRMGTSAPISTSIMKPIKDPNGNATCYVHCIKERWLTEVTVQSFGLCERWFMDSFFNKESDKKSTRKEFYDYINRTVNDVPIGSEGLIFHPFNTGSPYWNPYLKGAFYGITSKHEKKHFARSVIEGTVLSLKDAKRYLDKMISININKYIIAGGGAKSKLWTQIICDVLKKDALIYKNTDAALGAAMIAGIGTSIYKNKEEAISKCLKEDRSVYFNKNNNKKYEKLYLAYRKIHEGLMENSDFMHRINVEISNT